MYKLLAALGLVAFTSALDIYADNELAVYGQAMNEGELMAFDDDEDDNDGVRVDPHRKMSR